MKLSGYYKSLGNEVELKLDYKNFDTYDKVFISKVFTDTPIDDGILLLPNVKYGGTGFFYDKAPPLQEDIEHHFPDYHLYDDWVNEQLHNGEKKLAFKYYTDYSLGYTTRKCFRQCSFCVNRNYKKVEIHSPIEEFYDTTRKKICLLDDNFFGYTEWKRILQQLQEIKKPFQFKQGLDERLLTDDKCEMLFKSMYDGDYIFAFDNIEDFKIIKDKLKLIRKYTDKVLKFYVFCGFDRNDIWDKKFWDEDIVNVFKRIEILMQYHCKAYIMRYHKYSESPHKGMYITFARWCNQPNFYMKNSLRQYARDVSTNGFKSAAWRYITQFEQEFPEIANRYYDMRYEDFL